MIIVILVHFCLSLKKKKNFHGFWESCLRVGFLRQCGEGGVDGAVGPRTGAGERVVLAHCAGTRRVAFGVGNAWTLRLRDGRRA